MKRMALVVLVVVIGAVGFELVLNLLRQRNLDIQVRITGTQPTPPQATPSAEPAINSEGQAELGTVFLSTQGSLIVDVVWDYRIGPRFPKTIIWAEVQDKAGEVVAADGYTIECVRENALECKGQHSLELVFTLKEGAEDPQLWKTGEYELKVTRAYATLKPDVILTRALLVVN